MVGSHLADHLLAETSWNVVGMARWRSPMANIQHLVERVNDGDRLSLRYADLNDHGSLFALLADTQPDYVFHLAAQSFPTTSFTSPVATLETNVLGTCRLLECIRQLALDAAVHVCASSEVFGRVPREWIPIGEDTPFHPASPYAISKAGADLLGRFYGEAYGMRVVTTRMFTHTGPRRGDVFAESSFAKQIARIEAGMAPPVVRVGNLASTRTILDVRDAVRAYRLLLTSDPPPGSYFNIGGDTSMTVGEILDALVSMSTAGDVHVEVDPDRVRPIDADLQIPDTSRFRSLTGWRPEIPVEQTLRDLLAHWREQVRREPLLSR